MKSLQDLMNGGVSDAELISYTDKIAKERDQQIKDTEMQEREHKEKNNLVQLDLWANCQRGVPNSILRGCLFSAVKHTGKAYLRETLFENDTIKIVCSGHKLRQIDLDVWETLLHLARLQNLGNLIDTTEYNLLQLLGVKSKGDKEYNRLRDSIAKLGTTWVQITHSKLTYTGHLIGDGRGEDDTGRVVLKINPAIARLYEGNRATWIQWEERQAIGQSPMAKWLHGYISSHAKWYPHKVKTLKNYSGSEGGALKDFRGTLKRGLQRLQKIGFLQSYRIDEHDLVHIERSMNKTQQKHLDTKERGKKH